ncbi:MAG: cytochrome c [Candidatus Nitrohelix vancouverensis]|uniref:Cytochrome c n=1 Tax=Candidatus Nitrohelix vancouverensis TaxID=2705534 RepID=A0A7T0C053_9BACT|nr:MAG: cytochrome c [Candidatus Nitrohelix vancouverensis]
MTMNRVALIAGLFFMSVSLPIEAAEIPALFKEKNCAHCHRLSADDAPAQSAPDLFYAGDKFQKKWIRSFLIQPETIRKAGYSGADDFMRAEIQPHPTLTETEATSAAEFLMSLKIPLDPIPVTEWEPLSRVQMVRFKILFERDYGCISCHEGVNLAGKPRGGISGPTMVDTGNRLQADWVFRWLQNPETFRAKGRMPKFDLDVETAEALTRYLMTLKKENLK